MNVILDTCAMIWCVSDPDSLSSVAQTVVQAPDTRVFVSVISCAEVACLADSGKITVTPHWRTWFDNVVMENGWSVLDIDLLTVQEAFSLPGDFHRDPADRFITAAARLNRMSVVTADQKILDYPHVQGVW
ncbi:MAG: type II toxin-antitoxin system VapC family toxin [Kiritimatiellia bacterium]|jgi:PIN domain nuclease of toxin-antitoxin system|nr:type II toxin-antitoxin system VapC family toxin [Planctomycetota bacterium]MDP6630773.1 type II toxin-antitoxin system VapC family toxin [Kiritimatiellia bacterium]MDP6809363.1 type II toxin-antitoxin system VapC family toxin [Kiritimatiellia bacterium]MDP7023959.1 type II toxin-antitoxin system VapC family toxin [Kiritimatiellia bacterium]